MKKITAILKVVLVTAMVMVLQQACEDKEANPQPLTVVSVATNLGVPLYGASVKTDIPVNSSVIITFDKEVDVSTVDFNSIAIKMDGVGLPSTLTAVGTDVTITPTNLMRNGTNHTISIGSTLKATDGAPAAVADYNFKTYGRANVVPPQSINQLSYFSFSGNMKDEVGNHTPVLGDVRDLAFSVDRFGYEGLAGEFNGTTTIVEIPDGEQYMAHKNMTLSVWIKADAARNGHFVLGLGAWKGFHMELASDWSWIKLSTQFDQGASPSDAEDNLFSGTGLMMSNGGYQGWTFHKDVQPHGGGVGSTYFMDKWAQVVCTYDAATKLYTMYINGEKVKQSDFDLWPVDDARRNVTGVKFAGNMDGGNKLALGFIQASQNRVVLHDWANPAEIYTYHYKGLMDDVRIFKVALTETEVATLYTAEKP